MGLGAIGNKVAWMGPCGAKEENEEDEASEEKEGEVDQRKEADTVDGSPVDPAGAGADVEDANWYGEYAVGNDRILLVREGVTHVAPGADATPAEGFLLSWTRSLFLNIHPPRPWGVSGMSRY